MGSQRGKVALITGGAKGIGLACARAFVSQGCFVAIASRSEIELRRAGEELGSTGEVMWQVADVSQETSVRKLIETIERQWGRLDYLVNNAAIVNPQSLLSMPVADWDEIMAVNVRGPFLCSRLAAPLMKRSGGGAIVNIGSLAGIRGTTKFPGFGAYTTSKFAIVGLTEALAVELKEDGIRVNCVAPGAVNTELLRRVAPHLEAKAQPTDIANSVVFLCNAEQSRCTTGTTLELFTN